MKEEVVGLEICRLGSVEDVRCLNPNLSVTVAFGCRCMQA